MYKAVQQLRYLLQNRYNQKFLFIKMAATRVKVQRMPRGFPLNKIRPHPCQYSIEPGTISPNKLLKIFFLHSKQYFFLISNRTTLISISDVEPQTRLLSLKSQTSLHPHSIRILLSSYRPRCVLDILKGRNAKRQLRSVLSRV